MSPTPLLTQDIIMSGYRNQAGSGIVRMSILMLLYLFFEIERQSMYYTRL